MWAIGAFELRSRPAAVEQQGGRCLQVVLSSVFACAFTSLALSSVTVGLCSRRLNLLERVSADAVTTILHRMIEERMEQRCRGEYEHSFLNEFQEVRRAARALPVEMCSCSWCCSSSSGWSKFNLKTSGPGL